MCGTILDEKDGHEVYLDNKNFFTKNCSGCPIFHCLAPAFWLSQVVNSSCDVAQCLCFRHNIHTFAHKHRDKGTHRVRLP